MHETNTSDYAKAHDLPRSPNQPEVPKVTRIKSFRERIRTEKLPTPGYLRRILRHSTEILRQQKRVYRKRENTLSGRKFVSVYAAAEHTALKEINYSLPQQCGLFHKCINHTENCPFYHRGKFKHQPFL